MLLEMTGCPSFHFAWENENFFERKAMIRILFSDFDSTFGLHGRVSQENIRAVHRLHENGIDFALVSGRPEGNLERILQGYRIEGNYIGCNGAIGVLHGQGPVFVHSLQKDAVQDLIRLAQQNHWFYLFYELRACYLAGFPGRLLPYSPLSSILSHRYGMKIKFLPHLKGKEEELFPRLTKMNIYMGESNYQRLKEILDEDPRIRATSSGRKKLEIMDRGISKWMGISEMAKILGFSLEEVATIGDFDNDIDMLENAPVSFAVKNGSEGAKKAAKFQVKSCKEGGFAQACDFLIDWNQRHSQDECC